MSSVALALACSTSPRAERAVAAAGAGDGGAEPDDSAQTGDAGQGGAAGGDQQPVLIRSEPALGTEELYPAPLTAAGGEQLRLRFVFSAPLTAGGELTLRGGTRAPLAMAEWSEDGRQLELIITGALGSAQPLEDDTRYELDLSSLRDTDGRRLVPDQGLDEGVFWFVTGRYDALLNHACGHAFFGPFESGAAGEVMDPDVLDIGATHVQYSVSLPQTSAGFAGWVTANFSAQAAHRLYFDAEASVSLVGGDSLIASPARSACAGITHELTLEPPFPEPFFLFFHAQPQRTRRVIVELVPP